MTIKYPTPRPKTPTLPPPLHRARREEEVPFLEAAYQARMAEDRVLHEEQQVAFLASHRTAWVVDVVETQRLAVMLDEKAAFQVRAQGMPYRGGGATGPGEDACARQHACWEGGVAGCDRLGEVLQRGGGANCTLGKSLFH